MKNVLVSLCLAAGLFGVASAQAADAAASAPAKGEVAAACKDDFAKYCPGIEPGGGKLKGCIKENRKNLSPECKKSLGAAMKAKKGDE